MRELLHDKVNPLYTHHGKALILMLFLLFSFNLNAQLQIVPPLEVCDGEELMMTVSGLPVAGNDEIELRFTDQTTGISYSSTQHTGLMATFTFSTGWSPNFMPNNGDMIRLNASIQDPTGMPVLLNASSALVPLTVYDSPAGNIANTMALPQTICQDGTWDVTFTSTCGTCVGPFDLTINGTVFAGVASGGIVSLTEGVHFTGDGANIELTKIVDTGVPGMCAATVSSIVTGPEVIEITTPGVIVASTPIVCIQAPADPGPIYGDGTNGSTVEAGDGVASYDWEESTDGGATWVSTGNHNQNRNPPAGANQTKMYRRQTTFTLNGVACTKATNEITITIEDGMAIAVDGDGDGNTLTETVCDAGTTQTSVDVTNPDGHQYYVQSILTPGTATTTSVAPYTRGDNTTIDPGTLTNPGVIDATITYTICAYTNGPDGMDNNAGGDDCLDLPAQCFNVVVTVEPELKSEVSANAETICSGTAPSVQTGSLDGSSVGVGDAYLITALVTSGVATGFTPAQSAVGATQDVELFPIQNIGFVNAVVNYKIFAYSFGPNGMDDGGLVDDCVDPNAAFVNVTVEPVPRATITDVDMNGDPKAETICHNTVPSTTVDVTALDGNDYLVTSTILNNITGVTAVPYKRPDMSKIETNMLTSTDGVHVGTAVYTIAAYTYGPNGIDDSGMGDDCVVGQFDYTLTVEPKATATTLPDLDHDGDANPLTETICSADSPTTIVDVTALDGNNYLVNNILSTSFDAGVTRSPATASYTRADGATIDASTLSNTGTVTEQVSYTIVPYTYGPNGMDDGGAGDDCLSSSTFVVLVDVLPEPKALIQDVDMNGDLKAETICHNTVPTTTVDVIAPNGNNYLVSGVVLTNITGVTMAPFTRPDLTVIETNMLTSTNGVDVGTAVYTIAPYTYGPDGVDNSGMGDDCVGGSFEYTVTVEPQATAVDPPDETICSGDNAEFDVLTNMTLANKSFNWSAAYGAVTGGGGPKVGISFGMNAISDGGLINATGAPIVVTYTITPYTWGQNGADDDGVGDDCPGVPITVDITVDPTPEATIVGPDPNADADANIYTEGICSGSKPNGKFDAIVGVAGRLVAVDYNGIPNGLLSVGATIADNGFFDNTVLVNKTTNDVDVTYTVCPYSFGPDGIDNQGTGDDCIATAGVDDNGATNNGMGSCVVYTVTVHPEPVGVNQTFTVCSGDNWNFDVSTYFSNFPMEGVEWLIDYPVDNIFVDNEYLDGSGTSGPDGSDIVAMNVVNNSTQMQTIEYTILPLTVVNGCTGDPFTVTINVLPVITANINPNGALTLCNGESRDLIGSTVPNGVGMFNYQWGIDAASVGIDMMNSTLAGSTTTNPTFTPALSDPTVDGTVVLYFEVTEANNGCQADRQTVTFNVYANPAITVTTTDNSICEGESTDLIATINSGNAAPVSYLWSDALSSTTPTLIVSPTESTLYTVTVTNGNGCSTIGSVVIIVTPEPTAPSTINEEVCVGAANATIEAQCANLIAAAGTFTGAPTNLNFGPPGNGVHDGLLSTAFSITGMPTEIPTGTSIMVDVTLDTDSGSMAETTSILGEDNATVLLPATNTGMNNNCNSVVNSVIITALQYNNWVADGTLTLYLAPNSHINNGLGCNDMVQATTTFNFAPCTINWYDAVAGGNLVGTGSPFDVFSIAMGNPGYRDPNVAGVFNYYAECSCNGCPSTRTLATVTINAAPVINIDAAGPFCEYADPVNLSATPAGGSWSGTGITNSNLGTFDPEMAYNHVAGGTQMFAITYSYTDGNSCMNSAVIMISVEEDVTPPTFDVCPPATPAGYTFIAGGMDPDTLKTSVSSAVCQITPTWVAPVAMDDCALDTYTNNVLPFYSPGNYTITYTATDKAGLVSTCTFILKVVDDVMPNIIACPADVSVDTDQDMCDQTYSWNSPAVSDPCGLLSWRVEYVAGMPAPASLPTGGPLISQFSLPVTETFYLGVTTVRYIAVDAYGNEAVCAFDVTVTEDDKPTFEDPDDISMSTQTDGAACPDVATVSINPGVIASGMAYTVAGLAQTAPALEATYDAATNGYANGGYADACDANPELTLVSKTFATDPCSSTWTLVWRVTDDNGNFAEQTQVFTIIDNTAPTGNAPANTMGTDACMANATMAIPFVASNIAMGYSDNCGGPLTVTLTNTDLTGDDCSWSLTYTYKVADVCGNELTGESVTHTGSDQTAPALTGAAYAGTVGTNACMSNAMATFSFDANLAIMGYTDNCGAAVTANLTNTAVAGTDCAWTLTYTYEVIDACGNILPGQTYTHQGSNQTAPSGASTASTTGTNLCLADVAAHFAFNAADAVEGYTDACGNTSTSVGPNAVAGPVAVETGVEVITGNDCGWTVTYTFKVIDGCGNELTGQTYTHTGSDQTAPALTGAPFAGTVGTNACKSAATGLFSFDPNLALMGYTDNCGAAISASLTNTEVTGTDCAWTLTYTYDVTDACGNTLPGQTYTHQGGDTEAPMGATTAGSAGVNACLADVAGMFAFDAAAAVGGYTDNCGGLMAIETGNEVIAGTDCGWSVTYTFKVVDGCGNELLGQTYAHTGSDQTAPTLTGAAYNDPVNHDACMANAAALFAFDPALAAMGYTDNCNGAITINQVGGEVVTGTDCNWTVTYTYDVVDVCSNTLANQTYSHSGSDQTDPTWTSALPADQSYPLAGTGCVFTVPFAKPTATDFCTLPTVSATAVNIVGGVSTPVILFDLGFLIQGNFPVGQNDVTITAVDACGNSIAHTFTITILDSTPPTIMCPAPSNGVCDITEVPPFGNGSVGANAFVAAGGILSDNCVLDYSSFTLLSESSTMNTCPKVYSRVYQIADAAGNTNICTHSIIIDDNTAPVITFTPAAVTIECSDSRLPANTGGSATATDNCAAGVVVTYNDVDNLSGCGGYTGTVTRTWTATDACGNTATSVQIITIEDNTAPVMPATCTDINVMLDVMGNYTLTTADMIAMTAGVTDACANNAALTYSADIINFNCSSGSPVAVTVTVTDPCGNANSCTANVTIVDNVAPVAVCPAAPVILELDANGMVSLPLNSLGDGSSTDNCGAVIETNIAYNFDCTDVGPQTVSLIATDGSGNFDIANCTVMVVDNIDPVAACPATPLVLQLDAMGSVTLAANSLGDGSSTDNCGIASETNPMVVFGCADIGPNMVPLTATDVNGNTNTVMCTVMVVDNVAPVAVCQNISVTLDANGMASIVAADVDNGSSDVCGAVTLSIDVNSFTCADTGSPVLVTLTVTDASGNTDECPAMVTVIDNIDPVAVCPAAAVVLQLDSNGSATLAANSLGDGSSTDNCGIASETNPMVVFGCADIGANMVPLTATDVNGNTNTAMCTVTVQDNLGPVFTCPAPVTLTAAANACFAPYSGTINSITDNCTPTAGLTVTVSAQFLGSGDPVGVTITELGGVYTIADVAGFPVGDTEVTVTAQDANGNSTSCSYTVTVDDIFAPVITNCPADINATADPNTCMAIVNWVPPTVSDFCPGYSVTASHNPGDAFPIGTTTVTYTAVDQSGNTSVCSFDVIVAGVCMMDIDMSASYSPVSSSFLVGDTRDLVCRIRNLGADATVGQISFAINKPIGFNTTFNATQVNAFTLIGITPVNNSDWTVSTVGNFLLFQTNVVIAGGSESKVAIHLEAVDPGASANTTLTIQGGSGGETDFSNNSRNKLFNIAQ